MPIGGTICGKKEETEKKREKEKPCMWSKVYLLGISDIEK